MPSVRFNGRLLDVRADRLDLRDRAFRPSLHSLPRQFPKQSHIELLLTNYTDVNNLILDQGKEGACTGFGLAAVINYLIWREAVETASKPNQVTNVDSQKVSPRMLYNMARIYDEWEGEDYDGSSCRGAMKGWHRHGVCKEATWPYQPGENLPPDKKNFSSEAAQCPIGAYYRIDKGSVADMQSAIYEVGAVYCSAQVHQGWQLGQHSHLPIIELENMAPTGGHAFALVGYNEDGFIVQNSWGADWGFKGFAVMKYADWVSNGYDAWIAVRGAPIAQKSPLTFSHAQLKNVEPQFGSRANSAIEKALNYPYQNPEVRPWDEETAYMHSLVIGNNGRPMRTLITHANEDDATRVICFDKLKEWLDQQPSGTQPKIAIYAHGGLNSEQASINRTRVMAPYFKANGIYPVFVTWKTGVLETLSNLLEDYFSRLFKEAGKDQEAMRAEGFLDTFKDAIDNKIESFSRSIGVKSIWNEMKENARKSCDRAVPGYPKSGRGARPGGMVILAKTLQELRESGYAFEVHLVGHSAGSILFAYWLKELKKRAFNIDSMTLYAPALTTELANQAFIAACDPEKGVLSANKLEVHLMDDERERADTVASAYGKSLLYLVSRGLEDIHKMPLLGLELAWDDTNPNDVFNQSQMREVRKWKAFASGTVKLERYDIARRQVLTNRKGEQIPLTHGSFDNDIIVVERTLQNISGGDLTYPVENLCGF